MIAMGIAQAMLKASIKTMNPAVAILGGIALVAAGAVISNLSKKELTLVAVVVVMFQHHQWLVAVLVQ